MARKSSACGDDIVAIEELMQDLETRLRRLNKTIAAASGAASAGGEFVIETLAGIVERVRDGALTSSLTKDAAQAGSDALKKLWDEIERRPLATLVVAAGIGYLLGLIGRRD
jgi:ElaB/YqjD/DUF883 family membrane-anchored ribosome-binding protein